MTENSDILNIENLLIGYFQGTRKEKMILPPLNLSVAKGELLVLVGPNGIGKSTLLRTIGGFIPALKGKVLLSGREINTYPATGLAKKISFVFTGGIAMQNMSVFELVSLGRFPHTNWLGYMTSSDKKAVEKSIDNVGLRSHSGSNISQLSDGEKQRAMIARALAQDTELIILDEPTAFLDLPNRHELVSLLKELSVENNKSVIFSSHDIHIAIREADKIWLASNDGIRQGSPEDLVLKGEFDRLFDNTEIYFVKEEGQFSYPVKTRMTIKLDGEGVCMYWTERALNRLGIKSRSDAVSPMIRINDKGNYFKWIYESAVEKKEFDSVYSLILYMKEVLRS